MIILEYIKLKYLSFKLNSNKRAVFQDFLVPIIVALVIFILLVMFLLAKTDVGERILSMFGSLKGPSYD